MFSCVIPTMWRHSSFMQMLEDLLRCDLVGEVILIDNADNVRPPLPHLVSNPKFKYQLSSFTQTGYNMGVNPAWNVGVARAENDRVLILNDDLQFNFNIFYQVKKFMDVNPNCGVIGFAPGDHPTLTNQPPTTTGVVNIIPHVDQHKWGFGEMMFIRKSTWIPIPNDIKIFYGDDWIYETNKLEGRTNYLITDSLWNTPHSVSSKSFVNEYEVPDREAYMRRFETLKKGYKLAEMIRHA